MSNNKYGSVNRMYTTRNLFEDTLTVGTDIVVTKTPNLQPAPQFSMDVNQETNFIPVRMGVFSNFADGLVLKDPANRLDIYSLFTALNFVNANYDLDVTYGSKAVSVSGGTSGWVAGFSTLISVVSPLTGRYLVFEVTPINGTTGTLGDYWPYATGTETARALDVANVEAFEFKNISTLNCMYDVNELAEPFSFSGGSDYDLIALRSGLNFDVDHDTEFMTHNINSAFDDSTVHMDIVTEIDFTPYNS